MDSSSCSFYYVIAHGFHFVAVTADMYGDNFPDCCLSGDIQEPSAMSLALIIVKANSRNINKNSIGTVRF
jgi:hypothetical protein